MKKFLCKDGKILFETDSKALPRGGQHYFLHADEGIKNPVIIEGEIVEDPVQAKIDLITEKYGEMVTDVYAQMFSVFGTNNDVSASAFATTWEAMKKRPENYVDIELGFADELAVTNYADAKLLQADQYGVYRMKRIGQYQAEKAAIEGVE